MLWLTQPMGRQWRKTYPAPDAGPWKPQRADIIVESEVDNGRGATNGSPGKCGLAARIAEPICLLGIMNTFAGEIRVMCPRFDFA